MAHPHPPLTIDQEGFRHPVNAKFYAGPAVPVRADPAVRITQPPEPGRSFLGLVLVVDGVDGDAVFLRDGGDVGVFRLTGNAPGGENIHQQRRTRFQVRGRQRQGRFAPGQCRQRDFRRWLVDQRRGQHARILAQPLPEVSGERGEQQERQAVQKIPHAAASTIPVATRRSRRARTRPAADTSPPMDMIVAPAHIQGTSGLWYRRTAHPSRRLPSPITA